MKARTMRRSLIREVPVKQLEYCCCLGRRCGGAGRRVEKAFSQKGRLRNDALVLM